MATKTILKIVLSSPGDVQPERERMERVIAELNRGIADERNLRLELIRWETAAFPGFHPEGPQGQIDPLLNIPDCDILLGIFWQRIGTPTKQAPSGSAHEFMTAYRSWKENGRPQIMMYFKTAVPQLKNAEDADQYTQVLRFKEDFPEEGLYWTFADEADFEQKVREHLTKLILRGGKFSRETPEKPGDFHLDEALRRSYLNWVFEHCRRLSLSGIDRAAGESDSHLNLDAVYTALRTTASDAQEKMLRQEMPGREKPALPVLEQLNREACLVLLGDPGSGKSTFVNFAALCLAGEALGRSDANLALLRAPLPGTSGEEKDAPPPQAWEHGPLLPLRVILRDFAARGLPPKGQPAGARHLWEFIAAELQAAGLEAFTPSLEQELHSRPCLLLLDGLDEIPEADDRRTQIKNVLEDFHAIYPNCRMLVTSRTYAYQKQDWKLRNFSETVLAPFSEAQIDSFITHWYDHLGGLRGWHRDRRQSSAEMLKRAIAGSERLRDLAERPLLLTLMASLHAWRGGTLPEKREELYSDAVDLLLDWWERPKVVRDAEGESMVQQPSLAEWLKVDRDRVRDLLNELAFQAHADQAEMHGTADIPEGKLVNGLLDLSNNPDVKAKRLIEYLMNRAGLLLPRGVKVYTFPHRTFQEYLAACYLTDNDFPDKAAELAREEPNRWREVALLAGAKASRGSASMIWSLVDALCHREPADSACSEADAWGAQLAAVALVEPGAAKKVSEHNLAKIKRVKSWLLQLIARENFPARERAAAGANLARLGDPRREVTTLEEMQWCYVPGGAFHLGSAKTDKQAYDTEKPVRLVESLAAPYWLSRYPVTNAQFAEFVKADGYQNAAWWPEAKETGYWQDGKVKSRWDDSLNDRPTDYGIPFNLDNAPVVGVTWYEALAFTRWLTEKWRKEGLLSDNEIIRLPSESEWEKAARGGLEIPRSPLILAAAEIHAAKAPAVEKNRAPQRIFPWGDDADPERMNFSETNINATSAVGCFSGGASPYGCEEMSGNVWEWCQTKWRDRYDHDEDNRIDASGARRVVRGGGWGLFAQSCRVSYRDRASPVDRDGDLGFRLLRAAD